MENALIVSNTDKQTAAFTAMLKTASVRNVTIVPSCGEARRLILERDFDLVLINSPLLDESGESLSRHIVSKGATQVILAVKREHFEAVATGCESVRVHHLLPFTIKHLLTTDNFTVRWWTLNKGVHRVVRKCHAVNAFSCITKNEQFYATRRTSTHSLRLCHFRHHRQNWSAHERRSNHRIHCRDA